MVVDSTPRGPIAWMTRNHVAANLLMIFFIAGGIIFSRQVKQEVFPEVDLDMITISVPYPGASPAEVEQGIILPIEEGIRGLDGIKKVTASAREGSGMVTVELLLGTNQNKLLQDVKNAVDRIVSFPQDSERPVVSLLTNRNQVLSVVVYGDQEELIIRRLASELREELLDDSRITLVELSGVRSLEISVEVPQNNLRSHNLTLEQVAASISKSALELPGGGVKDRRGETLLRLAERRNLGKEFAALPLVNRPDGTSLRVGDLARVIDGLTDNDQATFFNGKRAAQVEVYRVGDQTPLTISAAAKEVVERFKDRLPPGMDAVVWNDRSEIFHDRIDLLFRNARLGLILVMVLLGLFLEARLAFWVTLGIPISFLGALLFMPAMDVSVNMISLFAFIVSLGIVVDDAIVVGENIYEMRQRGMSNLEAAVAGARQVAVPVAFSIMTNIAAFMPLFFVPGIMGKFFRVIPAIVVSVFIVSWVESVFILPAHLGHQKKWRRWGPGRLLGWVQDGFSRGLERLIEGIYAPFVATALRWRYLTISVGIAMLVAAVGLIQGDLVVFRFMPRVEGDVVTANAVMPYGSPPQAVRRVADLLVAKADETLAEAGGRSICRGVYATIGNAVSMRGHRGNEPAGTSNQVGIMVYLVPSDQRKISSAAFEDRWRELIGEIPGLESLSIESTGGPGGGANMGFQLSHPDIDTLERAASELARELAAIEGVIDVDKGFQPGKPQLDYRISPEGSSLGLTASDLGRQLRSAFYGAEALRQQRGRDEIRVYVRLPEEERKSEHQLEELLIRTPSGGEIPLSLAAEVEPGRAYTQIQRTDGRRAITISGFASKDEDKVREEVVKVIYPRLARKYAGLKFALEGQQRDRMESIQSLGKGFLMALVVIFTMLAIPFRSYLQPLIIMAAIPFGVVGALIGHMLMGYDVSLISMMGIVALSGVVVNDSLVLVHAVNRYRFDEDNSLFQALVRGGCRRFRPILLTSLTTFLGLAPMIFETSMQARFLIPMAISLGFGILFATVIALVLVPCLYHIIEDFRAGAGWLGGWLKRVYTE